MSTDTKAPHKISYDKTGSKEPSYDHKRDKNPLNKTLAQSDNMVDYLLQKFGNEGYMPFYRKASWLLSDDTIRRLVTAAIEKNANSPVAYFIRCVKREKAYYRN